MEAGRCSAALAACEWVSGVLLAALVAARGRCRWRLGGRGVVGRARALQLRQAVPGQHLLQQVAVVAPMINPHLPQRLHQPPLRSAFLGRAGLLRLRFNTPKRSVVKLNVFLTTLKKILKGKPKNLSFFQTEKTSLYSNVKRLISNIQLRTMYFMFAFLT